jgi:hypothetical protein
VLREPHLQQLMTKRDELLAKPIDLRFVDMLASSRSRYTGAMINRRTAPVIATDLNMAESVPIPSDEKLKRWRPSIATPRRNVSCPTGRKGQKAESAPPKGIENIGGPGRTRTCDNTVMSGAF